jgi:hypothetical protein
MAPEVLLVEGLVVVARFVASFWYSENTNVLVRCRFPVGVDVKANVTPPIVCLTVPTLLEELTHPLFRGRV